MRIDQPPAADGLQDRDALPDRPGHRDDLEQRLKRLPPGHPSSPVEADGTPRPREPGLRLRESQGAGPPGDADRRPLAEAERAEHVTVRERPDKARAAGLAESRYVTDPDAETWTAERSSPRSTDLDHDKLAEPRGLDHGRDDSGREPDAPKRDYWTEVPRFLRAWADHVRQWPAEVAASVDRSRDPEGSWRGDGSQYLGPDEHARAKDEIAAVHEKEEALTKQMGHAERENTCGGWLAGLEHRLKGEDRLKEKIAELLEASGGGAAPEQIVRDIPDAIRYTFCFEPSKYADGYTDIKQRIEADGFRMIYIKNHWRDDAEYKGVNTRWVTAEGQRFEVQFHTPESFHAKQQVTHKAYERSRSPLTSNEERGELAAFQQEVCSWITAPDGALDIPDNRTRGR